MSEGLTYKQILDKDDHFHSTKKKVAKKMIWHNEFDREKKKWVKTLVPETKEHAKRVADINKSIKKAHKPSHDTEYQKKYGRDWYN